uniref:RWD domain-containing protein n=1 Tax=Arcella intermedia TaxID=1963864 RepID=A0A6B2LHX8_9EUKA|eukprot:TRINITY_DN4267_c0_g1_i1.p1 TRINITY_DN4267_c0_g1~~TRINITY_DN4267_c0_g1_i1.p1  ORF type:complete len:234 (+),score=56.96 TRINITY_DN4267_c0_g1_i1:40-702(+)
MDDAREDELQSLESIYMDELTILDRPSHFEIKLLPVPDADDPSLNKVSIKMEVKLPTGYPSILPEVHLRVAKGVSSKNCTMLEERVREEAKNQMGEPMIYILSAIVKEWLDEHNDEEKDQLESRLDQFVENTFEKDGTPVTVETFTMWWTEFKAEMEKNAVKNAEKSAISGKEFFARGLSTSLVAPDSGGKGTEIDWELFTEETEFADVPGSDELDSEED